MFARNEARRAIRDARRVYFAAKPYATSSLTRQAVAWYNAAYDAGDVAEVAEACWELVIAGVLGSGRQTQLADRTRVLAESREVATEAGYWLGRTGQCARAVRAVEFSRAVMLSRLTGWIDPIDEVKLRANGREDLLGRHLNAQRALASALRRQYGGEPTAAPGRVVYDQGSAYPISGGDLLDAARAEVAAAESAVAEALSRKRDPVPPPLESIQEAADPHPIVYLAASAESGYALLVRAREAPIVVWLPTLTAEAVEDQPRGVQQALDWLIPRLRPLAAHLSDTALITLIPLGPLGTLPLHAALADLVGGNQPLAVRYAPNARILYRHKDRRSTPVLSGSRVLAVDAPQPAGPRAPAPFRRIPETRDWLRQHYSTRLVVVADARADDVLKHVREADICHFTCHGIGAPTDSLDGRLLLTDRPLTVRELFASTLTNLRLVILGACESQVGDARIPDEAMNFPSAWLQAGAEAVIAAQWGVDQQAALLVLLRTHALIGQGREPPSALAAAQHWLRAATQADLAAAYPTIYRVLSDSDTPPFAGALDWAAFAYTGR